MKRKTSLTRSAFTLVELCLAMIISVLIASAVSAFLLSVSKCWAQATQTQNSSIIANQLSVRLFNRVQDLKRIGFWRDGTGADPAGFIYWRGDSDDDSAMETGELAVMAYDPAGQAIVVYLPAADGGDEWSTDDLADSGAIDHFTTGLIATPIVRNVTAATLKIDQPSDTALAPTVTWTMQLTQPDGSSVVQTVSASVRAPGSTE